MDIILSSLEETRHLTPSSCSRVAITNESSGRDLVIVLVTAPPRVDLGEGGLTYHAELHEHDCSFKREFLRTIVKTSTIARVFAIS